MESGPSIPEEMRRGPDNRSEDEMLTHTVPEDEMAIDFVRSSGPGGQNVNKRATKVVLRWNVGASAAFSEEEKEIIRTELGNRINADGEIVLTAQVERSQAQNKDAAIRRLQELVAEALAPRKARKPTRPSRAERERRLEEKRRRGEQKRERKEPRSGW